MSDQLVAEAANYTTQNKPKRRTAIPSKGFKLVIPAKKRLHLYALHRTSTGIDSAPFRM
jgi:hypothetical protein